MSLVHPSCDELSFAVKHSENRRNGWLIERFALLPKLKLLQAEFKMYHIFFLVYGGNNHFMACFIFFFSFIISVVVFAGICEISRGKLTSMSKNLFTVFLPSVL